MDKHAMEAGRRKHLARQRREKIGRVVTFERWLKAGSRLRDIPPIPRDSDYVVARAAGKLRR